MADKRNHPANAGTHYHFIYMVVWVEIRDNKTDKLIAEYETDLADSQKRRTFAEQMSEAYAANQYSIVSPTCVQRRIS